MSGCSDHARDGGPHFERGATDIGMEGPGTEFWLPLTRRKRLISRRELIVRLKTVREIAVQFLVPKTSEQPLRPSQPFKHTFPQLSKSHSALANRPIHSTMPTRPCRRSTLARHSPM